MNDTALRLRTTVIRAADHPQIGEWAAAGDPDLHLAEFCCERCNLAIVTIAFVLGEPFPFFPGAFDEYDGHPCVPERDGYNTGYGGREDLDSPATD